MSDIKPTRYTIRNYKNKEQPFTMKRYIDGEWRAVEVGDIIRFNAQKVKVLAIRPTEVDVEEVIKDAS